MIDSYLGVGLVFLFFVPLVFICYIGFNTLRLMRLKKASSMRSLASKIAGPFSFLMGVDSAEEGALLKKSWAALLLLVVYLFALALIFD